MLRQSTSPQVFVLAAHQAIAVEAKLQVTNAYTQLKRKLQLKVQKHVTLIVKFRIEDKTSSIVKIVTDMQLYDCSIEVPLLITSLYNLPLFIRKTFECFLERKKEKKRKRKMNS